MNKKLPIISLFFMSIVSIMYWTFKPKDELYEAKWNAPDTTLAITINGEISTTFPTTNAYTGTVECTTGTGKVEWNGSKWILTTSGITKGSTKCNAIFNQTLRKSILANNEVKTPITTPGAAISTESEALLASTEDDYGTSYYFRGAVTNNYVEFANKCWRIVRVGGDGSVKLILHNDNFYKVTNPCSRANNSYYAAFARYSGATYESTFNEKEDDNAYVGFMYGTAGSLDYASTHANINKSTIFKNLEIWYNNNLILYESKIEDNVFCTDKTNITDTSYNPVLYGGTPTGLGFGKNKTIYAAMQRLVGADKKAGGTGPSLKCNGLLSKITSKVGLITVDELAYAGYAYGLKNTTTYLQENTDSAYWWSLTPGDFSTDSASVGRIYGYTGELHFASFSYSHVGVRPLISLVSSVEVTGSGTSEDPYVVK